MTFVFPINFNTVYRKKEEGDEELSPPSGLCLTSEGNILLADDFNHRIQEYKNLISKARCYNPLAPVEMIKGN